MTSVDNASSKSPTKESQLKPANTEVSRTNPSQPSPANGSTEALEFSKDKISWFHIQKLFLLEMSAAEYREKLKAQQARKRDPRQDQQLSMKQKHDLIDRL